VTPSTHLYHLLCLGLKYCFILYCEIYYLLFEMTKIISYFIDKELLTSNGYYIKLLLNNCMGILLNIYIYTNVFERLILNTKIVSIHTYMYMYGNIYIRNIIFTKL